MEGQKAFRVKVEGFPSGIYAALSRSKAAYMAFRSANDIGYGVKFADIHVKREPYYDQWAANDKSGHGWLENYLPKQEPK